MARGDIDTALDDVFSEARRAYCKVDISVALQMCFACDPGISKCQIMTKLEKLAIKRDPVIFWEATPKYWREVILGLVESCSLFEKVVCRPEEPWEYICKVFNIIAEISSKLSREIMEEMVSQYESTRDRNWENKMDKAIKNIAGSRNVLFSRGRYLFRVFKSLEENYNLLTRELIRMICTKIFFSYESVDMMNLLITCIESNERAKQAKAPC